MVTKIYVGNLPYGLDDQSLRQAFYNFGTIVSIKIVKDKQTGESRGFGFIEFESTEGARGALGMGGQMLNDRKLFVKFAREKQNAPHNFNPDFMREVEMA